MREMLLPPIHVKIMGKLPRHFLRKMSLSSPCGNRRVSSEGTRVSSEVYLLCPCKGKVGSTPGRQVWKEHTKSWDAVQYIIYLT